MVIEHGTPLMSPKRMSESQIMQFVMIERTRLRCQYNYMCHIKDHLVVMIDDSSQRDSVKVRYKNCYFPYNIIFSNIFFHLKLF